MNKDMITGIFMAGLPTNETQVVRLPKESSDRWNSIVGLLGGDASQVDSIEVSGTLIFHGPALLAGPSVMIPMNDGGAWPVAMITVINTALATR